MFNYNVYINIVSSEPIISLFHLLYNFKILIWSSIAFLPFFFIIISHLVFFLCSSKAPNNVSSLKLTYDKSCVSLVDQTVKYLPEKKETWVWYLGREDPLGKGMAAPVFLVEESHGQRSLLGYSPWGCKESDMTMWLTLLLLRWKLFR